MYKQITLHFKFQIWKHNNEKKKKNDRIPAT